MTTIVPKKRIISIDALRGFALIGIMLLHCMERFDLTLVPEVNSPFWQCVDKGVYDTVYFLFSDSSVPFRLYQRTGIHGRVLCGICGSWAFVGPFI